MKIKISRSFGFVGTDDAWEIKVPDDIAKLSPESDAFQQWYQDVYQEHWDEMCERLELSLEVIAD
mgnify:CR=1 FL=1